MFSIDIKCFIHPKKLQDNYTFHLAAPFFAFVDCSWDFINLMTIFCSSIKNARFILCEKNSTLVLVIKYHAVFYSQIDFIATTLNNPPKHGKQNPAASYFTSSPSVHKALSR